MNTIRHAHNLSKTAMLGWEHIDELLSATSRGWDIDDTNDLADMIAHNGMSDIDTYRYIVPKKSEAHFSRRFDLLCAAIGSERVVNAMLEVIKAHTSNLIAEAEYKAYNEGMATGRKELQDELKRTLNIA